jgi:hypothetical protein
MRDEHASLPMLVIRDTLAWMSQQSAEILFWIASAACAIAELAILRSVFAPHGGAVSLAPIPHSPRGAEMLWAVIPAVALAALLAATWRAIH